MKKLNKISKIVINIFFKIIDKNIIQEVKNEPEKKALELIVNPFEKMVSALVDENPNNQQQLKEILKEFKNSSSGDALEIVKELVNDRVGDEITKELVLSILEELKAELQA